jgi:DNA repair exonuclease SbcCD ATPase subunit
MTRIVGFLEGASGPLSGRLYVKAGGAFIGAPAKDLSFKVEDGIVDVELPPCPPGMPYFVDWKDTGDISRLKYVERWRVPAAPEVSIEEVRGLVKSRPGRAQAASKKGELLEAKMLKNEINELTASLQRLEQENAKLLREVTDAESKAAAAQAKSASMVSELTSAKRDAIDARLSQQEVVIEKVVERTVTPADIQETISDYRQRLELMARENEALKKEVEDAFSLTTHYASLHSQIDRLTMEKHQLLSRIDELKRPKRSTTSLRNEAIANLDRLISG